MRGKSPLSEQSSDAPNALITSSTRADTDMKMATESPPQHLMQDSYFYFGEFDLSVQMTQFVRSCTEVLHDLRLKVFGGLEDCFIVKENKT